MRNLNTFRSPFYSTNDIVPESYCNPKIAFNQSEVKESPHLPEGFINNVPVEDIDDISTKPYVVRLSDSESVETKDDASGVISTLLVI